jgi:8-oxo-dGTP pyrophosphatase MutT (NUDIX family)
MSDETYVVNVEAAIFHGDTWLMILRSAEEAHAAGTLSFVGGKVERAGIADNILEKTLRREIAEEVGVTVADNIHYVESKSFIADDGLQVVDIVYLCRYDTGEPRALDPAEVASVEWMTFDAIMAHPKTQVWIKQSLRLAATLKREVYPDA